MISIQDIIEFYKEVNPNKSESTYTTMKYNVKRLEKITQKDIADLSISDFVNLKKIQSNLDSFSLNTQIQTICGIKLFLKYKNANEHIIKNYELIMARLCGENQKKIESNELSQKEKDNWIKYPDLLEKVKQYIDYGNYSNDYTKTRNILLLAFYTLLPPTRIGNFQYLKIRHQKKRAATSLAKTHNYIYPG